MHAYEGQGTRNKLKKDKIITIALLTHNQLCMN